VSHTVSPFARDTAITLPLSIADGELLAMTGRPSAQAQARNLLLDLP